MGGLPSPRTLAAILYPPSNAASLDLYDPPDPISASINTTIIDCPLSKALRANPDFVESRPHLRYPPSIYERMLTGGTLTGPHRIWVPPLTFSEKGGKSIVVISYLGKDLCGHPGVVHGGMLATMLDEGLARCCFEALPNKVGMTASLKVDYRKPCKAESYLVLRAWTTKVEGRKAWVRGRIEEMPVEGVEGLINGGYGKTGNEESVEGGIVFVEAEALYVEPRQAAAMGRLLPPATD
ncbi:hypothetical protein MMC25_005158 [Agyrium rufum]|nr:hypothetical protein [Agyrium rufum]